MDKKTSATALSAIAEKELRSFNNSFFDVSLLAGWLRCEASPRFEIHYINEYFVKLLGYDSREELLARCGGSFVALMDQRDDVRQITADSCALPTDGDAAFTYRLVTKTGGELWVREHSHKYLDPDGTPMLLSLCIDITDIVSLERSLEQQKKALKHVNAALTKERRYQEILNANIPVGTAIFKLDDGGTLLHVGGTMLKELGYTWEEFAVFQENHLRGFVLDADYGTAFCDARVHPGGPPPSFEHEYRAVKKDGSIVWMHERGTLVEVAEGERGYVSVFIDVTRRKEMEEQLRVSEAEMNLAMSQMGKMVCVYDPAARTLTMPEAYAAQYGLPAVQKNMPDSLYALGILSDSSREPYLAFYEAIRRGEKSGTVEYYIRRADAVWRWEHAEFAAIFGLDGKPRKAIVSIEDTTQRHAMADETETLRENERLLRMVAAHSNRRIYRYDVETKTAYADKADASPAGTAAVEQNVPDSIIERGLVLPESVSDFRQVFADIEAGKAQTDSAKIHMRFPGETPCWIDMHYSVIEHVEGRPKSAVLSFADITENHEKELAYSRYRQSIGNDSPAESVIYFETDLTADVVEKQGGNIPMITFPACGCTHMAAANYGIDNLASADEQPRARAFFAREHLITAFSDGARTLTEDWSTSVPGIGLRWFRSDIQMIQDPYSNHIKAYTILRDVTEEKLAALEVQKKAELDGNTGLLNKMTTEARIRERLADGGGSCALMIVDLDDFKQVNDRLGHAQGDRALFLAAETLRKQFRHTDVVGRIGGDEFMVFLCGAGNETTLNNTMTALMRNVSQIRIGEHNDVPLPMSIGVTFGTAGKHTFEELYREADKALYHVKRNGKNDYAFYTPDMEHAAYRYAGHGDLPLWQADAFGKPELTRLLYAVSSIYPLMISVNLTQNSYYMMQYSHFTTTACRDVGVFDELIAGGAATFDPADRAAFLAAFSRRNLLAAHARGETVVSHEGRQRGDDGVYRHIHTDVIFVQSDSAGNVLEITLAREFTPGAAEK